MKVKRLCDRISKHLSKIQDAVELRKKFTSKEEDRLRKNLMDWSYILSTITKDMDNAYPVGGKGEPTTPGQHG